MADDEDPRAGEAVTANYGWTKPNVMGSDDQWGGYLNADLDGIDSIVHGIDARPPYALPIASTMVLGGVKVDGTTIHAASDGTLSGTPSSGPPVTVSDTAPVGAQIGALWWDSVGGQLYTFYNDGNSSQWVIAVNAAASLLPASTTVLGGVKVDGTTIKAAPDGTISTTVVPIGDNRIINGDMRIDQRNNGASGTAIGVYTVDRWFYNASQAAKGAWQRGSPGGLAGGQFPYWLTFTSSSAYTSLAADFFQFRQPIEADMVSDFAFGTANAQPVTLSFWATASIAGTYSASICNAAGDRSYPFSFPLAAGFTKIVVTVPGDTAGTWALSGNGVGMYVRFDLGCGANWRGPANAWSANTYVGVTGSVSVVGTNGASFSVTGVKLEIGSVATPYNRQSLAKSMADCQRYYQGTNQMIGSIQANAANQVVYNSTNLPVTMRATPTMTVANSSSANLSALQLELTMVRRFIFKARQWLLVQLR